MIDIESEVYTTLKNAITTNYSGTCYVSSLYELIPKQFPACMIEQIDSYVGKDDIDSGSQEATNYLTYQISICATGNTRKSTVKAILNIVDSKAYEIGLTRSFSQPITLQDKNDIYEIVSRYSCKVSKNKTIYRR